MLVSTSMSKGIMKHYRNKHATVLNGQRSSGHLSINRDGERAYCNSDSENIIGVDEAGKSILFVLSECVCVTYVITGCMQDEDR